jgi:hypothetical protein
MISVRAQLSFIVIVGGGDPQIAALLRSQTVESTSHVEFRCEVDPTLGTSGEHRGRDEDKIREVKEELENGGDKELIEERAAADCKLVWWRFLVPKYCGVRGDAITEDRKFTMQVGE